MTERGSRSGPEEIYGMRSLPEAPVGQPAKPPSSGPDLGTVVRGAGESQELLDSAPTPASRSAVCAWCGEPFDASQSSNVRRYCSDRCRYEVRHAAGFDGRAKMDAEDQSPDVWDQRTRYNDLPRRRDYYLSCMMCGRGDALKLTDSDARNIPAQRCHHCGGRMLLDLDAGKATITTSRAVVRGKPVVLLSTGEDSAA